MSVRERKNRMHTPGMTDSSPASQDHEMENEQPARGEGSPVEHHEVSRRTFLSTLVREGKLEIRGSNRFNERDVMHPMETSVLSLVDDTHLRECYGVRSGKSMYGLTAASRIPPWLLSGWGCRGQRLSRG